MVDLEELKKLALAAMPGPWTHEVNSFSGENWLVGSLCTGIPDDSAHWVHVTTDRVHASELGDADAESTAEYIAAANPAAVLELISRAEKAEAKLAALRKTLTVVSEMVDETVGWCEEGGEG